MDDTFHASAKGVLVEDDRILLIQYQEPDEVGHHYNLPGGRIRRNEHAPDACRRKMLEEAGADVDVHELLFVYEYTGAHHNYAGGDKHSISLVFRCSLRPGSRPSMATCTRPDTIQTDVCWVPLDELPRVTLYPSCQAKIIQAVRDPASIGDRYWGDVF
ncbi:MAG TPA: NUDIX domain-containing protein [Methylomirabilota bacterium]|nr:NUDIX domain-containing protein [Methylomirabilota bacterium]